MDTFGAWSEVGRLRVVLLHEPGIEHRRTVPWNKDALLFDDILDVEEARPQHREFSKAFSDHGVEVLLLADLLEDICRQPAERREVCCRARPSSSRRGEHGRRSAASRRFVPVLTETRVAARLRRQRG